MASDKIAGLPDWFQETTEPKTPEWFEETPAKASAPATPRIEPETAIGFRTAKSRTPPIEFMDAGKGMLMVKPLSQQGGASTLGIPDRAPFQSVVRGLSRTVESAGGAVEVAGSMMGGAPTLSELITGDRSPNWVESIGKKISENAKTVADTLEIENKNFMDKLAEGVGSSAAFFIPGFGIEAATARLATVGPRLATWIGVGSSAFLESSTEAGAVYHEALRRGQSQSEATGAALKTFWGNLPAVILGNKLGIFSKGGNITRAISSMTAEGVQEFTQEIISNIALHDPVMSGALEAGAIGTIIGGGTTAIMDRSEVPQPVEQPAPAVEAAPMQATPEVVAPVQTETIRPGIERAVEPQAVVEPTQPGAIQSALSKVVTERGTQVDTEFTVVDAKDLIASHDNTLAPNENYPQELQPRQRERIASEDQINRIVNQLDPAQLGESRLASMGAPIVGPDNIVESGNGRVIAIRRAYQANPEKAQAYRSFIEEQVKKLGLTTEGMTEPVLVRVRRTDVDRVQFAKEANEQATAAMSATEQAENDAQKLSGPLLDAFVPDESGNIGSAQNRAFLRGFLEQVVAPTERGRYLTPDGSLSQEGLSRVRNAVFAKAYGDSQAVTKLAESTDNNVKNITTAMLMAAPRVATMKNFIQKGQLYPLDLTVEISQAMGKLSSLRDQGTNVDDYLNQQHLDPSMDDLTSEAKLVLSTFNTFKNSARKMADTLLAYTDLVEAIGDPNQVQMFAQPVPSRSEIWRAAVRTASPELRVAEPNPEYTTNLFTGAIEPVKPPVTEEPADLRPDLTTLPEGTPKRPMPSVEELRAMHAKKIQTTLIPEDTNQGSLFVQERARRYVKQQGQMGLFEYEHQETPKNYPQILRGQAIQRSLEQTGWWQAAGTHINQSSDLVDMFYNLKEEAREKLFVVSLDENNKILGMEWIGIGSLSASMAHPREMLKGAVALGAKKIAWGHNHPSHDLTPSADDKGITTRLNTAAELFGLEVAHNVIVEGDKFYSFNSLREHEYKEPTSTPIQIPVFETKKRFLPAFEQILNSSDLVAAIKNSIDVKKHETIAVIMDTKNRITSVWSMGDVTDKKPYDLTRLALDNDASSVALASDDYNPTYIHHVRTAMEIIGVKFLDSVEIKGGKYRSQHEGRVSENLPLYEGEAAKDYGKIFDVMRKQLDIDQVAFDEVVHDVVKHSVWKLMTDEQLTQIRKELIKIAKVKMFKGHPYSEQMKELLKQAEEKAKEPQELTDVDMENLGMNKATQEAKRSAMVSRNEARRQILGPLRLQQASIQDVKNRIVAYANANLPMASRGKMLALVKRAETQRDMILAFFRVEHIVTENKMAELRASLRTLYQKALSSPSVAVDYQQALKEVMSAFDPKTMNLDTRKRLEASKEFFERAHAEGKDVEMPRRLVESLSRLRRTPLTKLPLSRLQALHDEVERIVELGKTKMRVRQSIDKLEKELQLRELAKGTVAMNSQVLDRTQPGETLTLGQKWGNRMKRMYNFAVESGQSVTPMDVRFDSLDGGHGTYGGVNMRTFKAPIDAKYSDYLMEKAPLKERIIQMAKDLKLTDKNYENIGVYAAARQVGGMEKLKASNVTNPNRTLTPEEMRLYKAMRESMDSLVPHIQQYMKEVENRPFQKVEEYFPFLTDFDVFDQEPVIERVGSQSEESKVRTKQLEKGFTKARVGGKRPIQLNAMRIYQTHIDNAVYLIHLGKITKQLFEIANSDRYRTAAGDVGQKMVIDWLDTIARKGGAAGQKAIHALDAMRYKTGVATLGANLMTGFMQLTSLPNSAAYIGAPAVIRGASHLVDPEWRQFLRNFPELRARVAGDPAFQDERQAGELSNRSFAHIQYLDGKIAAATVAGAYEQYLLDRGETVDLTKAPDPKALTYAQFVLRRAQSSGLFKDVPQSLSRGSFSGNRSFDKMIFQFQNYVLNNWSAIQHDAIAANIKEKDPRKAAEMLLWLFTSVAAASGMRMSFNAFLDAVMGVHRKEDEDFLENVLDELIGNIPFVGQVYNGFRFSSAHVAAIKLVNDLFDASRGPLGPVTAAAKLAGAPGAEQLAKIIRRVNTKDDLPPGLLSPVRNSGRVVNPPVLVGR